jgi:hypothetical protein
MRDNPVKDQSGSDNCSIIETENELSDRELKASCYEYAKAHFQGKKYHNKEANSLIIVSRDGLGEWKTKSKSRDQILSIKILDQLLENAAFSHAEPDKLNRKNITGISYFNCRCSINGHIYNTIITVRDIKNYGYKYYHHYLEDIKIEPRSGITRPAGETG